MPVKWPMIVTVTQMVAAGMEMLVAVVVAVVAKVLWRGVVTLGCVVVVVVVVAVMAE